MKFAAFTFMTPLRRLHGGWLGLLLWLLLSLCSSGVMAEISSRVANPNARPAWDELSPAQRSILAPLQNEWPSLGPTSKKKWLKIAQNYPKMKPQDQQRTQERMHEWVQLTPEQHRVARDSYTRAQKLTPEKRAELLKAYQALPEEKKRELARNNQTSNKLLIQHTRQRPIPGHEQISQDPAQKDAALATVNK